eukprot:3773549-Pyramimonas_sp.AAC.1
MSNTSAPPPARLPHQRFDVVYSVLCVACVCVSLKHINNNEDRRTAELRERSAGNTRVQLRHVQRRRPPLLRRAVNAVSGTVGKRGRSQPAQSVSQHNRQYQRSKRRTRSARVAHAQHQQPVIAARSVIWRGPATPTREALVPVTRMGAFSRRVE